MASPTDRYKKLAQAVRRSRAYDEAHLKPWQEAQIRRSQELKEALLQPQSAADIRLSDIKWLGKVFDYFMENDKCDESIEQLRLAKQQFLGAVEHEALSPLTAFKKATSTTPIAQQMDTLYASHGGIDHYILNVLPISRSDNRYSDVFRAEAMEALRQRKVQEIKSLMAKDKMVETSGGPDTKALKVADGAGQGHEGEVEQSEIPQNLEKVVNINDETQLS